MEAIEERAIECCMTHFPTHKTADAESMKQDYYYGATDYLNKALKCFCRICGCKECGKRGVRCAEYNDFKKAMEE